MLGRFLLAQAAIIVFAEVLMTVGNVKVVELYVLLLLDKSCTIVKYTLRLNIMYVYIILKCI